MPKRFNPSPLLFTPLLLLPALHAEAAAPIKPGLWEMTMEMDPAVSDAMKKMPKLTPEQQEQMNKMGIKMPQMQGNSIVQKVCLTKEMVERDQPPMPTKEQSACKPQNFSRDSGGYSVDIICDSPDMKGSGHVKGTFVSTESFTSVYDFKGTARGRPIASHHESSGKWLNADCGEVKPYTEMMPKK